MSEASAIPPARPVPTPASIVADVALISVLVAVTVGLRVHFADADPSFDELWHLALSAGRGTPIGQFHMNVVYATPWSQTSIAGAPPAWEIWRRMDGVLHPPLYIIALRLWRDLFGDSDRAAQSLTFALAGVATIFQFLIARASMGRTIATLVALAMACAPTQIYLGQEIRGYQMLITIGTIGLWLMTRIEERGPSRGRAIALALVPVALVLTHYFGAGAALAITCFGLWRLPGYRKAFVSTLVATAVLYAIFWIPFALRQARDIQTGDNFVHAEYVSVKWETLGFASAPFRILVDRFPSTDPLGALFGVLYVLPWLLTRRLPALRPWALWLCASLAPLLILDVARSSRHLDFTRYLAVASPAVVPLLVGCVYAVHRKLAIAAAATVVFLGAIYRASGQGINLECASFSPEVRTLARSIGPDEGIVVSAGVLLNILPNVLMLTCSHQPGLFPRPIVALDEPMTPAIRAALPGRVWLLTGDLPGPVGDLIPGAKVLSIHNVEVGVSLYHLELDAPAATTMPSSTLSDRAAAPAGASRPSR